MCSISGFYDPTADFTGQRDSFLHILDEMKHCLAHRGPDDNDSLLTPHCDWHTQDFPSSIWRVATSL